METMAGRVWVRRVLHFAAVTAAACSSAPTTPTGGTPTPTPAPTVTVCSASAPQPMTSFTADPATITNGDPFTLRWAAPCGFVSLAQKGQGPFITLQPSTGSYALQTGQNGYPTATGNTVYEARNGDTATPREATVTVNPAATPTPTATPAPTCPPSCDDGNPCTTDTCVNGACQHTPVPNGTSCGDPDGCLVCSATGVCHNKGEGLHCDGSCGVCCSDGSCSGNGGHCAGNTYYCSSSNDYQECETCPDQRNCTPKTGAPCHTTGTCGSDGNCSVP